MSFEVCILKICLELEKKVIARMRVKKKKSIFEHVHMSNLFKQDLLFKKQVSAEMLC